MSLELRGGDQIKGTITEKSYKLTTFYGPVELPADRIVGMFGVGQVRPRQLLVTVDGEVFGGSLGSETDRHPALQRAGHAASRSRRSTRFGYRKRERRAGGVDLRPPDGRPAQRRAHAHRRADEPHRGDDPATGCSSSSPNRSPASSFQPEDRRIPEIQLSDGSRFAGLATADQFEMILSLSDQRAAAEGDVPGITVARLQFGKNRRRRAGRRSGPDASLTNDDQLVGAPLRADQARYRVRHDHDQRLGTGSSLAGAGCRAGCAGDALGSDHAERAAPRSAVGLQSQERRHRHRAGADDQQVRESPSQAQRHHGGQDQIDRHRAWRR